MHIYKLYTFWFLLSSTLLYAQFTTQQQVQKVVKNWLHLDSRPMGMNIGSSIKNIETIFDKGNKPLYHVVNLDPNGYVIVSGEDLVEPIIAFVENGRYVNSQDNPLGALIMGDVPSRVKYERDLEQKRQQNNSLYKSNSYKNSAKDKWLMLQDNLTVKTQKSTISDVRVNPFILTQWNQSTEAGGNSCYNLYTPNHYVSGCVATALAQVLRYYQYPTSSIGTKEFHISVDNQIQTKHLLGGDGDGGAYNWANMDEGNHIPLLSHRQAIGRLMSDAGVSVNMKYTSSSSATDTLRTANTLIDTFKYSNAVKAYNSGNNLNSTKRNIILNTNLDAGYPVLLGITGSSGGHAIIANGYGYNSSTSYYYLNMGWSGNNDAWYNLPSIGTRYNFTSVYKAVYNIYSTGSGEIISGRIIDSLGNPISNATVTATNGSFSRLVTTNVKGIYAISKIPSNSSFNISVSKSGYLFTSQSVTIEASISNGTTVGNKWGIDFTGSVSNSDDSYEPNDSLASAYDISNNEYEWISGVNGLGIQSDDDWYKIYVDSDYERVYIKTTFKHSEGDIDLRLYDSFGTELASSISSTDNEIIDFTVPQGDAYYYIKFSYGDTGNSYNFWWDDLANNSVGKPDLVINSVYIDNNLISTQESFSLDTFVKNQGTADSSSRTLRYYLSTDDIISTLDTEIGTDSIITITPDNTISEVEVFTAPSTPGTYWVGACVDTTSDESDINNNCSTALQLNITAITDDSYEENNELSTAYDISYNEDTWLSTISGYGKQADIDWYKIYVTPGSERLQVFLYFTHTEGDIDLSLYDTSHNLLVYSASTTDNENIDYIVSQGGTYYLKVYFGNKGNSYDLWWDNLIVSTPTITSGQNIVSNVSDGQMKYYKIHVENGKSLKSTLQALSADIDLYIKVGLKPTLLDFDCYSTELATNNEACSIILNYDSDVYIGVYGYEAGSFVLSNSITNGKRMSPAIINYLIN